MTVSSEPKTMSQAQYERTKASEGFSAGCYADGKNGQSVGYGFHLGAWPELAKDIQLPITKDEALELLHKVDRENANYLASKYGMDPWNALDPRQRDALLSVSYNAGAPGVWQTIKEPITSGDFEEVANRLETHAVKGCQGDKTIDLSMRRKEDADLFRTGSQTTCLSKSATMSVGIGATYSPKSGWQLSPLALSFNCTVVVTGPAALVVGGAMIGIAAWSLYREYNRDKRQEAKPILVESEAH